MSVLTIFASDRLALISLALVSLASIRLAPFSNASEKSASVASAAARLADQKRPIGLPSGPRSGTRSEEHTSELQSLMRISYAVFCLKKKTQVDSSKHHKQKNKQTIKSV